MRRALVLSLLCLAASCSGSSRAGFRAVADLYVTIGNVLLTQPAATGLLANDSGAASAQVTAFDAASLEGGEVAVAADGGFTYNPPVGFEGQDSFTYEITEDGTAATATGTVTINVNNMVWFIDDTAAAGGDGRFNSRFQTVAEFNAVQAAGGPDDPEAGDLIFLFDGTGTGYAGPIDLKDNQELLGEGVDLVVSSTTLVPAGTAPTLGTAAGNGVNLANANRVAGLAIDSTATTGISGQNVAGPTLFESLTIRNTGGDGVDLGNCTGTFTFVGVDIANAGDECLELDEGPFDVNYTSGTVSNDTERLMCIRDGHTGTMTFGAGVTITAAGGDGIQFRDADGTYTFDGPITMTGGNVGIDIFGGSDGTFTFASLDITNPTGLAVNIDGNVAGQAADVTIRDLAVRRSVGHGVSVNNSGRLTIGVNGTGVSTIDDTTGDGVNVLNTDFTISTTQIGGARAIGDDGIEVVNDDGVDREAIIDFLNIFPNAPATNTIPGRGIFLDARSGTLQAMLRNNFIVSDDHTVATADGGAARSLLLDMTGNSTLTTETTGVPVMEFVGSGLDSTIVTSWDAPNQVIGRIPATGSGGILFDRITFDADGDPSNGRQQVRFAGELTIGAVPPATIARIQGDGLTFLDPSGDLRIGTLDIANNNGTGLRVDTKGLGTTFNLVVDGGTIDTTNGAAQFLDPPAGAPPFRLDLTFDRVRSTGSKTYGVVADNVRGTVRIRKLEVKGARKGAVVVRNSPDLMLETSAR